MKARTANQLLGSEPDRALHTDDPTEAGQSSGECHSAQLRSVRSRIPLQKWTDSREILAASADYSRGQPLQSGRADWRDSGVTTASKELCCMGLKGLALSTAGGNDVVGNTAYHKGLEFEPE